ncbi:FadR/GntR family transcriptional regulator [Sphingomonas sp. DT-207]|uniref:FadR/GntR family transcriptional regulator n=1 Tax=Sphingomonas sp. DT-207 TaxID=3396167 RepID=UPI003F1AE302
MDQGSRKLYQVIAEKIAGGIIEGRFPPGNRLPSERELAEDFGVSRPTIREAMIALEIRGLVEARHGSGIYVTHAPATGGSPELDVGAFELIEARVVFEGEAAALAATSIDEAALGELERLLGAMDDGAEGPSALDADRRFHLLIAQATGNSLVRSVVEMLWDVRERSPLCVNMFERARREGVTPRADEHRLIVEALRARDPQRAREAMRAHLSRVTEDLLEATKLDLLQRAEAEAEAQRSRIVRRVIA